LSGCRLVLKDCPGGKSILETQVIGHRNEKREGLVRRIRSGDLTVSNKEMLEAFRIEIS